VACPSFRRPILGWKLWRRTSKLPARSSAPSLERTNLWNTRVLEISAGDGRLRFRYAMQPASVVGADTKEVDIRAPAGFYRLGSIDASPEELNRIRAWAVEQLKFKSVFGPKLRDHVQSASSVTH
jgi:hypothetical protein